MVIHDGYIALFVVLASFLTWVFCMSVFGCALCFREMREERDLERVVRERDERRAATIESIRREQI